MEISSKSGCFNPIFNTLLSNIHWYLFFFFDFDSAGIQWFNNGVSNIYSVVKKR